MTPRSKPKAYLGSRHTLGVAMGPTLREPTSLLEAGPLRQGNQFILFVLLALSVWVVFGQTSNFDFINYDDDTCVYENSAVSGGVSWEGVKSAFLRFNNSEWTPLTTLSHMVDCQIFGLNAGGHHLTNVLLHGATVLLLFRLLWFMTGALWQSAFVAAVFAVHPLRVESVAWITERKDVLSGLFFVLATQAYVRHVRGSFKTTRYVLVAGLFLLGLLSKPMVVTLPVVLLLLDYWPLQRWRMSSSTLVKQNQLSTIHARQPFGVLLIEKIPFLLISAAGSLVTLLAAANSESLTTAGSLTFFDRIANALLAYVDYLGHMLYPVGLGVGYPNPIHDAGLARIAMSLFIVLAVSAAVFLGRRKYPFLVVGWLWYLVMLVPVIDIMQTGEQARADRYTYLPQIGLSIMVAWGAGHLWRQRKYRDFCLGAAAAATVAGLIVIARIQAAYWKDSVTLWSRCIDCMPANYIAQCNLGDVLAKQGKIEEAAAHLARAIELKPDYSEAHSNLGFVLVTRGNLPEAIQHCTRALQLKPDLVQAHLNLGIALAAQGAVTQAIDHYQRAIQLNPDYSAAQFSLGLALASQGRTDEAIAHYERALQQKPDYSEAHASLGLALAKKGKSSAAIEHLTKAVQLKPSYSDAHNNLGVALAAQGKLDDAIVQFRQALQLKADNNQARTNLNRALAEQESLNKPVSVETSR